MRYTSISLEARGNGRDLEVARLALGTMGLEYKVLVKFAISGRVGTL